LVICSFSLYFFTGIIPDIARVLKKDGIFIAITHYQSNMQELVGITRRILEKHGLLNGAEPLPIEVIVRQFSAENGTHILEKHYGGIAVIDFNNILVFHIDEINFFIEYFNFKSPFLLIGTNTNSNFPVNELIRELQDIARVKKVITMSKDDRIFICSQPVTKEQK
jgi:hypothetical protein